MLKKLKNKFKSYKESKLKITPGETVRNYIIESSLKASYTAGNTTDDVHKIATTAKTAVDVGIALCSGAESSKALGIIAFKAGKDIAKSDPTS